MGVHNIADQVTAVKQGARCLCCGAVYLLIGTRCYAQLTGFPSLAIATLIFYRIVRISPVFYACVKCLNVSSGGED